jgi:nucleoside-diphosphate-sugar epimerase
MKILVTGAAGFVGTEVVRAVVEAGHEAWALVRPSSRRERLAALAGRIQMVEGALDDSRAVDGVLRAQRPDAVIHAAWYANPTDYRSSRANLESLEATLRFAERVVDGGCPRLVALGSCLEYGRSDVPHRESEAAAPETLYGACKLAAANVLRALSAGTRTEIVWARLFHLHGAGEDPRRLLPRVARDLIAGRPVDLSPGEQVRDELDVSDVAEALVHLTAAGEPGVVNVSTGVGVTLRDLLTELADLAGDRAQLRFGVRPYLVDEDMHLVGDPARLRATGWAPRRARRESLAALVERIRQETPGTG